MTTTLIRPCALAHDVSTCTPDCAPRVPAFLDAGWDLTLPPVVQERPQIGLEGFVVLGHVGPVRTTVLSRFWTIPAHKNPIQRRMAALENAR